MSTLARFPARFHLDSGRLAAHILAGEGALFGFDADHEGGPAAAVLERFYVAQAADAIRGPLDAKAMVYPLSARALIVAVREFPAPAAHVTWPCRQVATYSFDADEIAPPGDACFEACVDGLAELLARADALLPDLHAIRVTQPVAA